MGESVTEPVRLERVGKTYGRHRALADVSLTLSAGQVTAIVGPNGAGKSTLLGVMSTLLAPTTGRVLWGSDALTAHSLARARIGYVGHDPGLYGDLTAHANLAFFARMHGLTRTEARAHALLVRVGLAHARADAPVRTFSRGMQQRLALARALMHEPDLLLFDEPAAALDPAGVAWLSSELGTERESGRVVVLVTHDLDAAAAVANQVVLLRRGRLAHLETRSHGFTPAALRALYQEKTQEAAL